MDPNISKEEEEDSTLEFYYILHHAYNCSEAVNLVR